MPSLKIEKEVRGFLAEYEACILGLEAVLELKIEKIDVFSNSMLIICQVKGE